MKPWRYLLVVWCSFGAGLATAALAVELGLDRDYGVAAWPVLGIITLAIFMATEPRTANPAAAVVVDWSALIEGHTGPAAEAADKVVSRLLSAALAALDAGGVDRARDVIRRFLEESEGTD